MPSPLPAALTAPVPPPPGGAQDLARSAGLAHLLAAAPLATQAAAGAEPAAEPAAADPDAAEPVRQWVHLLPAGTVVGRDGRGPYTVDAEAVLAAFAAHGGELPVDYEHQSLDAAAKAGPVPAAGWIEALEARPDGVWGLVRWTVRAAELLATSEYRYMSPVFVHEIASGRVVALEGAALTHKPNLAELQAAAASAQGPAGAPAAAAAAAATAAAAAPTEATEATEASAEALATREDLLAHIEQLRARLAQAEAAAQASAAAAAAAQLAQASQASAAAAATPDPAQWVARAEHAALASAHAELQAQVTGAAAEAAVAAAQAAGRLTPAMLEWARTYARSDASGFAAWARAAPAVGPEPGRALGQAHSHREPQTDPQAIARAAQAWQAEQERAGSRVSFAEAVAQVMRGGR